jgi:hypothetical protein
MSPDWLASVILYFVELRNELSLCSSPALKLGYAVAQLVEAGRYKPEEGGFDSRSGH